MIHEQMIKRSMLIERRISGNLLCEIGVDCERKILRSGYRLITNFAEDEYIAVFTSPLGSFAVRKNGQCDIRMGSRYYEPAMLSSIRSCCPKIIQCDDSTSVVLDINGKVHVSGDCDNDEYEAVYWENIDYISMVNDGVVGVTREGTVRTCGPVHNKFPEVNSWKNMACIKEIENGLVGLTKDGYLICAGMSPAFTKEISKYTDVISFDGTESVFAAVRSDGSTYHICSGSDDEWQSLAQQFFALLSLEKCISVKLSPWGLHFIKVDGCVAVIPKTIEYSYELDQSINTLTNNNCFFKNIVADPPYKPVSSWKLFNNPDDVLKDYEILEKHDSYVREGRCLFCGNKTFTGFLFKKCTQCGHKK